ncbi:MAG: CDP-alcohol phosphatidyltransferase family protein [Nitrospirae bacterium]|nr:CDP-alcohol phosphatidyltransferase family protein [Nitrospirota bacterium]
MLSARLGHFFDKPLSPIARRIPLSPNALTIIGFLVTAAAAVYIPFNQLLGGVLMFFGGMFDIMDGVVARVNGKKTQFGALLDSTLDRYSDAFILLAVAWYFLENDNIIAVILASGSLVGAFIISYVRARAEGIGIACNVGLVERPERIALLIIGCLFNQLFLVVFLLFFLTHITAIQRILYVRRISNQTS